MIIFDWSKVISIYRPTDIDNEVFTAEIDPDHVKTATKGARGRPTDSWNFLFSPEKFDREIGLS